MVVDALLALEQLHNNTEIATQKRRHGNLHPGTIVVGLTGIVNLLHSGPTGAHTERTPLGFQAPELLLQKYPTSLATDIFAVGALLYQCLTARAMYPMRSAKTVFASIKQRTHHQPEELSQEEARVLLVAEQATSYQPKARYRSARHMLQALLDTLGYIPHHRLQLAVYTAQYTGLSLSSLDDGRPKLPRETEQLNLRAPTFPGAPSLPTFGIPAPQPAIVEPTREPDLVDAGFDSIAGPCPTPVENIQRLTEHDRMPGERASGLPTIPPPLARDEQVPKSFKEQPPIPRRDPLVGSVRRNPHSENLKATQTGAMHLAFQRPGDFQGRSPDRSLAASVGKKPQGEDLKATWSIARQPRKRQLSNPNLMSLIGPGESGETSGKGLKATWTETARGPRVPWQSDSAVTLPAPPDRKESAASPEVLPKLMENADSDPTMLMTPDQSQRMIHHQRRTSAPVPRVLSVPTTPSPRPKPRALLGFMQGVGLMLAFAATLYALL